MQITKSQLIKMKILTKTLVVITLVFSQIVSTQTQQEEQLSLDKGPLEDQFEYIFQKSGNFKGTNGQKYEAVKYVSLLKLKANTLDSLKTLKISLKNSEVKVLAQQKEISDLKGQLENTQSTLTATNAEKDNMSLFGVQMSKGGYNILLWSIIGGLLALTLFFLFRFNSSNSATRAAKLKLKEVEDEFEEHRRVALEREQKVRRQLQDEINKNKDKK